MKDLKNFNNKTITLDQIEKIYKPKNYEELCKLIKENIDSAIILPIKNSKSNGKMPGLYMKYKIIQKENACNELLDEINYQLSTKLSITYYKNHLSKYAEHRENIRKLSEFITEKSHLLTVAVSMNERSFQIWGREKFLQKEEGKTILKNLELSEDYLNYYETSEPIAYYSMTKKVPQKLLIIENKDTYYTFRQHLINCGDLILGEEINCVIYGAGKGIIKAFKDFDISVEKHISNRNNQILYFGDLDYEGVGIYENFNKAYGSEYNIVPFIKGYEKMIDKAKEDNISLPFTKDGQNRNITMDFLDNFTGEYIIKINEILESNKYIPQEIINITDL